MKLKLLFSAILMSLSSWGLAWNSIGHKLIAQIAYDNLSVPSKQRLNHSLKPLTLYQATVWLDTVRDPEKPWLQQMHYVGIPFSLDGTSVRSPARINAISTLDTLAKQSSLQQSDLLILFHVVGDIHQPLHAVNAFSKRYLYGDKGGNLFYLANNRVARNLHAYWDKGGGYLVKKRYSNAFIVSKAKQIEQRYPCDKQHVSLDIDQWAKESNQIAISKAYRLSAYQKPSKAYQQMVKRITEQRIALAGCRLAAMLERLSKYN